MARTLSTPFTAYAAGNYGPYQIDGKQVGDRGARLTFRRGDDGTWPLTQEDQILGVVIEGEYGGAWQPLASSTFFGGVRTMKDSTVRVLEYVNVEWPQELIGGVMTPMVPDRVRATIAMFVDATTQATVEWLS